MSEVGYVIYIKKSVLANSSPKERLLWAIFIFVI